MALGQEGACRDEMSACCRMASNLPVLFNGFYVPFLHILWLTVSMRAVKQALCFGKKDFEKVH